MVGRSILHASSLILMMRDAHFDFTEGVKRPFARLPANASLKYLVEVLEDSRRICIPCSQVTPCIGM